jgi:hypothetical protein
MRRTFVGIALLAVVLAMSSVPAGAKSSRKPIVLTSEQAAVALLALSDVPTGWAQSPAPATPEQASATGGMCNGPNRLARVQDAGGAQLGLAAYYKDAQVGPLIGEAIHGFPTVKQAKSLLKATADAVSACPSGWDLPNPELAGGTLHITEAPLSAQKLGDQVYAYRENSTSVYNGQHGATSSNDIVLLRSGNHVLSVNRFGSGNDSAELQTFVQKAYDKFGVELQKAKQAAARKR